MVWFMCALARMAAALAFLTVSMVATAAASADPAIRDIRFGVDGARTRIVIETAEPSDHRAFTLAEPTARLVIDLPRADWEIRELSTGEGRGHGLVDEFRFFNNASDRSRLVFELEDPAVIARHFWLEPAEPGGDHRLVVDIERSGVEDFIRTSGFPDADGMERLIAERAQANYVPPERVRRVIVVDAGHGGRDPGAIGVSGLHEADMTLAAARELRDRLEATGRYDVVLTRDSDHFLELQERVDVAAQHRADLFLSLHADAAGNRNARGAAVFTLDDRAEGRARNMARNGSDSARGSQVNNILIDLELREKRNQSSAFAEVLVEHLSRNGNLRSNPHREENFYVLLDSRVPAVLLEMGFMTNAHDERELNSPSSRRRQMEAVVGAIDAYFDRRGDEADPQYAALGDSGSGAR